MKTIQWSIFIIYAVVSCCMIASQQALSDELNSTRKTVYQKRLNEQGHPNSFVRKPFDPRKLPRVELPDIPQTNSNGKKYLSPSNSGVSETWSSRYDTKVTSTYAWAYRNGLDSTGNVYVIGSVEQNLLIVKYNTDGTKLWEALYRPENISSPFNFDINDAVVDRGGNIYVTFFLSYDDIESYDVLTTKFNSNGTKIWEQRYQHIGELNQSFVAYDRGGNCYITFSYYLQYAQSGVSNIFTIKYDVSGFQKWMREFNGPANTEDEPGGISTDDSGNVFIAGYSGDYGMILKYDSLGNQQWVKYNNSGDGRIVLDNAGNMYVGGRFVSKYNSAGIRLWKSSYSSWAIALDNGGNLILYQDSLVKLNGATGNVLWTRPYGTPYSNRVTIDAFNNIYLCENIYTDTTRADMQIRKISSGGTLNWTNTYRSPNDDYFADITLDTNGDVYVTGTTYQSNYSMLTIKYSSDGDSLWGDRYSSTNNYSLTDRPSYLAVDSSGNVYVAGTYGGQWSSRQGMTTIKYNSAGDSLWRRNYEFEYYPGNARTSATSLAVDGNGNVYVTGYSYRGWNSEYYDYLTIKYNSNGDTLWTRTYNGTSNYYDYPVAIALDNLGNAYVTGYSYQQNSYSNDVVTIKYNPAGDTLWVRAFNGGDYYADYPTALTLDHSGNICITGYSRSNINDDASSNFITVKYSPTGDSLWSKSYDGPANAGDHATGIATDNYGNLFVTGYSKRTELNDDYATIKYDSNGVEKWVTQYNGADNGNDVAVGIVSDSMGTVYVTGGTYTASAHHDFATIKYDTNGVQQWIVRYNGPSNSYDEAKGIALDHTGNIYVTGWSYGLGTGLDYATVKYTPAGAQEWEIRHTGSGSFDDEVVLLVVDKNENVYVTGSEQINSMYDWQTDIVTIKYTQSTGAANPHSGIETASMPEKFELHQNYPNPFNPTTLIGFTIPPSSSEKNVELKVYNTNGQLINTLTEEHVPAGNYVFRWDGKNESGSDVASGVYVYELSIEKEVLSKKMTLVR